MSDVTVMLDTVAYDHKPSADVPKITERLKHSEPVTVPAEAFAQAVANGQTWCGGCYALDPSKKFGSSPFVGRQLFAIDIDNDGEYVGEDGTKRKRPLMPDEDGYLDPWEARGRWARVFHADPLMMYPSMSYRCEGMDGRWSPGARMKYRMVLDAGKLITDAVEADEVIGAMLRAFPEADASCSNHNRLFFGAAGRVLLTDGGGSRHVMR